MLHASLLGTPTAPDLGQEPPEWTLEAVCLSVDPELFFPEKGVSVRAGKAVCRACPVTAECLAHALEHNERFGIWGGKSERERLALERQQPGTGRAIPCPSCGLFFVHLGQHTRRVPACRTTTPGAA